MAPYAAIRVVYQGHSLHVLIPTLIWRKAQADDDDGNQIVFNQYVIPALTSFLRLDECEDLGWDDLDDAQMLGTCYRLVPHRKPRSIPRSQRAHVCLARSRAKLELVTPGMLPAYEVFDYRSVQP